MGKKKNIQLPRDKEELLKKQLREDIEHVLFTLSDVEMDDEIREDVVYTLSELDDVIAAVFDQVRLPKRKLKYPWEDIEVS